MQQIREGHSKRLAEIEEKHAQEHSRLNSEVEALKQQVRKAEEDIAATRKQLLVRVHPLRHSLHPLAERLRCCGV